MDRKISWQGEENRNTRVAGDAPEEPKGGFQGFNRPESNFFRMPNNWTDITAEINSLAELKVVEYILRHTWGFQEFGVSRKITIDEFMHGRKRVDGTRIDNGTKLSEQSVRNGLKQAIEDGYIIEETDARDRARIKKYYRLRMAGEFECGDNFDTDESGESIKASAGPKKAPLKNLEVKTLGPGPKTLDPGIHFLDPGSKLLDPRGLKSIPRTEKETQNKPNQRDSSKQTTRATPVAVVDKLLESGVSKAVAKELANQVSLETIEEWQEYIQQCENIHNPVAFLVKMLRAGEKPVWSRPVGRSQIGAIDFSKYTRPGGKYYGLVQSASGEGYQEEDL